MRDYKLTPAALGTFAQYDDQTASDPSIWNEFAAAAFRVGHSQVQGRLTLVSCSFCVFFLLYSSCLYSIFDLSQALRFQWRRSNGPVVHVELLLLRRFQVAGAGLHRQRHPGLNERSAAGHQSGIHFATNQLLVQVGPYYISWNENHLTNCVWKKTKEGRTSTEWIWWPSTSSAAGSTEFRTTTLSAPIAVCRKPRISKS